MQMICNDYYHAPQSPGSINNGEINSTFKDKDKTPKAE